MRQTNLYLEISGIYAIKWKLTAVEEKKIRPSQKL